MPAPTPVLNGTLASVQNRVTLSFTRGIGGEFGGRFEGDQAGIWSKMNTLIALGYHVVYENDASPIASVTFSTPTGAGGAIPSNPNADYTDTFQVMRNTVQKELLLSDHPLVAALTSANLGELKGYVLNPSSFVNDGDDFSGADANSLDAAYYIWALFSSGVRSVETKQPILRVTRVTNPLYDAPFDLSSVDRVLTTGRMINDSGVPPNFAIQLAELSNGFIDLDTMVGGLASGFKIRTDSLQLYYGWLKDAITSETVGTTKNQYVTEYKFGLYDYALYGARLA